jgi:hypothetical protein
MYILEPEARWEADRQVGRAVEETSALSDKKEVPCLSFLAWQS